MAEASYSGWRAVSELARAKSLIDRLDFESAAAVYQALLVTDLPEDLRIEAQTNLVAALCAMAQNDLLPSETALDYLEQAEKVQTLTLKSLDPFYDGPDWVSGRANLALIHLARHRITTDKHEILLAHMALDGTEAALRQSNDAELMNWVRSIRDYLAELRERRATRR